MAIDFKNYGEYVEFVEDNGVYTVNRNISEDGIKVLNEATLTKPVNRVNNGKSVFANSAECYGYSAFRSGCSSF